MTYALPTGVERHIAAPRTAPSTGNGTQAALNSGWVDGFLSGSKGRQRVRVPDWAVRLPGRSASRRYSVLLLE